MRCLEYILGLIILSSFYGCMLPGKVTRVVSKYYGREDMFKPMESVTVSSVNTDSLTRVNGFCKSEIERFFFLPFVVYNLSVERIECTVNPKVYARHIIKELDQLLSGDTMIKNRSIELTFKNIPSTFHHRFNHHFIYPLIFYFSISEEEVYNFRLHTDKEMISLKYVIRDRNNAAIIRSGELQKRSDLKFVKRGMYQSRKNLLKQYLELFDGQIRSLGSEIAYSIAQEVRT